MSVILGYKKNDNIVLAADNRLSDKDDTVISDDELKIIVINDNLAVAFSGNHAVQVMFSNYIKDVNNREEYRIEDILFNFETLFLSMKINKDEQYAKNILSTSSCFIVAGLNKTDEYEMYGVSFVNKELSYSKTENVLFPPSDVKMQKCCDIYVKYFQTDLRNCLKKTINDISKLSKVVSSTCDIWTLDVNIGNGKIEHWS